jgi:hypothetical protein
MKLEEQNRLRDKRRAKAEWLVEARKAFNRPSAHKMLRGIADRNFGTPERPEPETLADYWPCYAEKEWEGTEMLVSHECDDEGSWITKYFIPEVLDDDQLAYVFGSGLAYHYGGPGRSFQREPHIERSNYSTLITSMGGMDI